MLKIGDKLICKKACIRGGSDRCKLTKVDSTYIVNQVKYDMFSVKIDNDGGVAIFLSSEEKQWFYTLSELRKEKINKLNRV